jgi:hypothetical protein
MTPLVTIAIKIRNFNFLVFGNQKFKMLGEKTKAQVARIV